MSDVLAIFGILLIFGIAYPGLLAAWWLLFPSTVERARQRLDETPWACFWLGLGLMLMASVPIIILIALPFGPAKFLGWVLGLTILFVGGLGAAGLAAKMGAELRKVSGNFSPAGAFVRGALALELAAGFPAFGWFLVFPLVTIISLGATAFSLLRWMPRKARQPQAAESLPAVSQA